METVPANDPWQPKLWCGMQDRTEPTTRALARLLQEEEQEREREGEADEQE